MRRRKHVFGWALALAAAACWMLASVPRAQTSSGSIVEYAYDVVGNIVAIQSSSTQLAVASFSPASGPAGATVVIVGSGFSPSADRDSVRINGAAVSVVAAERTRLTITVPSGATTGPISVTVGGSTMSSATPFIVVADYGPPAIASFAPAVAAAGTTVAVAGSNFNPTIANDSARIGLAAATIASATSANMTVTTPAGTGSGHIQVTTPKGSAASSGFLFIPPGAYAANAVVATAAGAVDASTTLSVGAPGKLGLMAFDVVAPCSIGIFGTASTLASGTMQLLDPSRAVVASAAINTSGATIPVRTLTQSGTYTVAVIAGSASGGSITLVPGAPDLVVTSPSLGAVAANQNGSYAIPVAYTVKNIGSAATQSSWYDMAYLSIDGTLDNADQHLAGWPSHTTALAPGSSYTITSTFTTSTSTPAGSYTLFIKADGHGPTFGNGTNTDAGSVSEGNEANNTQTLSVTLDGPDLVVSSATVGTIVANPSGSFAIPVAYTVTNQGGLAAQPPWSDMAYLSDDGTLDNADQHLVGWPVRNAALAPGASYTVTSTFTTTTSTAAGNYTLFIKADGHGPAYGNGTNTDRGNVVETNDANNARTLAVTLARPDLVVTSASLGSIAKNSNGSYRLTVTYTVQNAGNAAAQPSWVDMAYLSVDGALDNADQHLVGWPGRSTVLAPGASYTVTGTFTTTTSTPPGSYTLFIKADGHGPAFGNGTNTDAGSVVESNDANNTWALTVTLAP
ncbi:MAG TPA: CARDB domain-containing protein [Casimicrobiaceae bacterium]|nr:CARDB domain-containing protein [Casimicrobiaceae bacterium]